MTELGAEDVPDAVFVIVVPYPPNGDPLPLTLELEGKSVLLTFGARESAEEFMAHPRMDVPGLIKEITIGQLAEFLELAVVAGWADYLVTDPWSDKWTMVGPYPAEEVAKALKQETDA